MLAAFIGPINRPSMRLFGSFVQNLRNHHKIAKEIRTSHNGCESTGVKGRVGTLWIPLAITKKKSEGARNFRKE